MLFFNVGRLALATWAGWRVVSLDAGRLPLAALAGALVCLIDHVVMKGGYFLGEAAFGMPAERHKYLLAFGGVCVSYVMLVFVPAGFGVCGGLAARSRKRVENAPA